MSFIFQSVRVSGKWSEQLVRVGERFTILVKYLMFSLLCCSTFNSFCLTDCPHDWGNSLTHSGRLWIPFVGKADQGRKLTCSPAPWRTPRRGQGDLIFWSCCHIGLTNSYILGMGCEKVPLSGWVRLLKPFLEAAHWFGTKHRTSHSDHQHQDVGANHGWHNTLVWSLDFS